MRMTDNTMLITGGGSGIGRALAHRFHDAGNRVIVAGRRRAALEETVGDRAGMTAAVLDIEDADAIRAFADRIATAHPALNVLVNNAGIMRAEDLTGPRDLADAEATVVTNLLGPIRLTDALTTHLSGRADAAIVNVTSGLAHVPLLINPTYCATKAALHSYTISLRERLRGRVEVIELVPPGVQTELTPGQSTVDAFLPLDAFIDETMTLFALTPTPPEILVQRVQFLRQAERQGRFDETLRILNAPH